MVYDILSLDIIIIHYYKTLSWDIIMGDHGTLH